MEYLEHWGLNTRPFENNRDMNFFYPGCEHIEALERLLYLVRDGNMCFGLLTGEIGSGKTMVLHQLCEKLQSERYLVVHLPNGNIEFSDILREAIHHMENHTGARRRKKYAEASKYELMTRFTEILEDKVTRLGKIMVMVIDEAQSLSEEDLIELKNLTNLGTMTDNSITIILSGQPEISEMVRSLPQINQRVGLRYHLPCLSMEGTSEYLDYRMESAGGDAVEIFGIDVKQEIYKQTEGIPREINRLCKLALDRSFSLGQKKVSVATIRNIAIDIHHQDALA
ncbi:MAG: AAA family ATPase [Planctomycetes bacterium]|nr:AAA family ATPase [Planctomycetota bacterium]